MKTDNEDKASENFDTTEDHEGLTARHYYRDHANDTADNTRLSMTQKPKEAVTMTPVIADLSIKCREKASHSETEAKNTHSSNDTSLSQEFDALLVKKSKSHDNEEQLANEHSPSGEVSMQTRVCEASVNVNPDQMKNSVEISTRDHLNNADEIDDSEKFLSWLKVKYIGEKNVNSTGQFPCVTNAVQDEDPEFRDALSQLA